MGTEARSPDTVPDAAPGVRPRRGLALVLAFLGLVTLGLNDRRVAGWTISDVCFLGAGIVVLCKLFNGQRRGLASAAMRRSSQLVLAGALVMLTGGTLSTFTSLNPLDSSAIVLRFMWLTIAWFWILRTVVPDRYALAFIITGLKIGAVLSSGVAILGTLGIDLNPAQTSERQSAFFPHANGLAGYLASTLPFFLVGVPAWTHPRLSTFYTRLGGSVIVMIGILATGSMTATLAVIASSAIIIFLRMAGLNVRSGPRRHPIWGLLTALVVLVTVAMLASSDSQVAERFSGLRSGDRGVTNSVESRGEQADVVLRRFEDRLVLGTGFDVESARTDRVSDYNRRWAGTAGGSGIHNMVLKMYHEGGGVMVVGFVIVLIGSCLQAWRVLGATRGDPLQGLPVALLAAIGGLSVLAQFQPIDFERFFWLPVALCGVVWSVRRNEVNAGGPVGLMAGGKGQQSAAQRPPDQRSGSGSSA